MRDQDGLFEAKPGAPKRQAQAMGRRLLLRGEDDARGEWRLPAACHNFRKIFRHTGTTGLAPAIA